MHIEFRQAATDEWRIIQTIAQATWPVTYGQLLPAGQLEYMLDLIYSEKSIKQQMEREHQFSIGYHAGEPLGFASVEKKFKSPANFMIHKLYVLPSFQRSGIGKEFLNYLTMLAKQTAHDTLMLKVFVKNQNAIRFYQHLGFHSIGKEATELGNGYTVKDYVMIRKIRNGLIT
jgi:diamine N-acetyltransferase